jgi:hypothetical protein
MASDTSEPRPDASRPRTTGPLPPEAIAAAARELEPELLEAIALRADEIADDLGERLGMVAWEREEQIGSAQRCLLELREAEDLGRGEPVLVRELRAQPLEALDLAWRALRAGRRVHVESEAGACPGVYRILRELSDLLGGDALSVTPPGVIDHDHASWRSIGVSPRHERVALIQADADRELAAYVLARACLRRSGFDPRVVHRVIVIGPTQRLEQNLRRLWIGARMGPVDDEHAFAGPVDDAHAARFTAAESAWRALDHISTICPGGTLQRADAPGQCFLAPALFRANLDHDHFPKNEPAPQGPMLVIYSAGTNADAPVRAERLVDHFALVEHGRLRFGSKPRDLELRPIDRQIHGALLVERLPPGLPEPRP